jgi:TRAP-type C4-dicarboxylate transport system permease small subunit
MTELYTLLGGLLLMGLVIAVLRHWLDVAVSWVEQAFNLVALAFVLFIMAFVTAEIGGRYLFNTPIPGHLELSELFMPAIVFLAMAYTQATDGHIRLTILVERFSPGWQRLTELVVLLLSLLALTLLAYYSGKIAYSKYLGGDVTMSPPYFAIWPSSALVSVGLWLTALRVYLQLLHLAIPQWRIIREEIRPASHNLWD